MSQLELWDRISRHLWYRFTEHLNPREETEGLQFLQISYFIKLHFRTHFGKSCFCLAWCYAARCLIGTWKQDFFFRSKWENCGKYLDSFNESPCIWQHWLKAQRDSKDTLSGHAVPTVTMNSLQPPFTTKGLHNSRTISTSSLWETVNY